jgi:threonine/homoserine/homoserine lactone efflux protein
VGAAVLVLLGVQSLRGRREAHVRPRGTPLRDGLLTSQGPWLRRFERVTGAVLVGLGVRLALERR